MIRVADALYVIRHIPGDDAPTMRTKAITRLLQSNGYSVDLLTTSWTTNAHPLEEKGFNDVSFFQPLKGLRKTKKVIEMLSSSYSAKALIQYCEKFSPKMIVFYGGSANLVKQTLEYAAKNNIATLVDETDWFRAKDAAGLYSKIYYYFDNKKIAKIDETLSGQIAISPFFYSYFCSKGCDPFFLPAVFENTESMKSITPFASQDSVNIVYVGSLGDGKDSIVPFIRAVMHHNLRCSKKKVVFTIVGASEEESEFITRIAEESYESEHIRVLERMLHEEALEIIKSADFSILFRREDLYARAGFSTKLAESMCCATPVICNRVGGADSVIDSWVDGIILEEITDRTLREALERIELMSVDELRSMQRKASRKASKVFDLSNYVQDFGIYLNKLNGTERKDFHCLEQSCGSSGLKRQN